MPDRPVLHGDTILLRPLTAADADTLYRGLHDEEFARLTGTQRSFTLAEVRAHYARVETADDRVDYAIVTRDDPDRIVGEVVLNEIDVVNRSANFRIALLSPLDAGKGYGTQATRLMVAFGFERLALHRIELEVFAFNPRAIRVYEKAGFVREGVRRDALWWNGEFHDAVIMAILRPEYERRRSRRAD